MRVTSDMRCAVINSGFLTSIAQQLGKGLLEGEKKSKLNINVVSVLTEW